MELSMKKGNFMFLDYFFKYRSMPVSHELTSWGDLIGPQGLELLLVHVP